MLKFWDFESQTNIFLPLRFFNVEILNGVSLNIYHENIIRIIQTTAQLYHFKMILDLISKTRYFDIQIL